MCRRFLSLFGRIWVYFRPGASNLFGGGNWLFLFPLKRVRVRFSKNLSGQATLAAVDLALKNKWTSTTPDSNFQRVGAIGHSIQLIQSYGFIMPSKALEIFEHAIQDAIDLLSHFDSLNKKPPPPEIEVLKRASLIMALAALETYFEDLLIEYVSALSANARADERLSDFFRTSLDEDLKRFHTPSTDRVRPMFIKYLGYDVTEGWSWNNCEPAEAKSELNRLAKKRGEIAHRSWRPLPGQPVPHAVTRDAMRKHIHFITELVNATDAYAQKSSNNLLKATALTGQA